MRSTDHQLGCERSNGSQHDDIDLDDDGRWTQLVEQIFIDYRWPTESRSSDTNALNCRIAFFGPFFYHKLIFLRLGADLRRFTSLTMKTKRNVLTKPKPFETQFKLIPTFTKQPTVSSSLAGMSFDERDVTAMTQCIRFDAEQLLVILMHTTL